MVWIMAWTIVVATGAAAGAAAHAELVLPELKLTDQCQAIPPTNISNCMLQCEYCGNSSGVTNATCTEPVSGKRVTVFPTGPAGSPQNAPTQIAFDVFYQMMLALDANATHTDCACTRTVVPGPPGCFINLAECTYLAKPLAPALWDPKNLTTMTRARAWNNDTAASSATGHSAGYDDPAKGVVQPKTEAAPSRADFEAYVEAAHMMESAPNAGSCASPTSVPPLVVIPGLTSSSIEYKLDNSPPLLPDFWCNRSTDGYETLWPIDMALATTHPAQFACWAQAIGVEFDPRAQTFGPKRKRETTRLVDFGGFDGIPGLGAIYAYFSAAGWELGKTLFAAPFDWRVPSAGQDEFYSKTKQLVETASQLNDGKKVALWAFSFGPQYTLSFLHRMSQEWKDQYIDHFVATSPVWSGAPAALHAYVSGLSPPSNGGGGGGPVQPPGPSCKKYQAYTGTCYTGSPVAGTATNATTINTCCAGATAGHHQLFNYFAKNRTCVFFDKYVTTSPCADGELGYVPRKFASAGIGGGFGSSLKPAVSPMIKAIARASPSLIWAFPRAGADPEISYTASDVLIQTATQNYTAFDYLEVLKKLGVPATDVASQQYLAAEPDLAVFAAPGVDTTVTYGTGWPSPGKAIYNDTDLSRALRAPVNLTSEDGDGLVTIRASLRGHNWTAAQAALGKSLQHLEFPKQNHANCFPPTFKDGQPQQSPDIPLNVTLGCWDKIIGMLLGGH